MTYTLSQMMDEVQINLSGYTYQQDRSTYLTTAITTTTSPSSSPLVISLANTQDVGKGTIEIGDELLWVDSVDRVANTATISPYGRGYLGTTAATHPVDSKVTISPIFPRNSIQKSINDTIQAIASQIYAVKQTTFAYKAAVTTYNLGDNLNVKNILNMSWQSIGPSKEWVRIRRYDFDPLPYTGAWGEGAQTVTLHDFIVPGRTVKVMYATYPEIFTSTSQDFSTQTGLDFSVKDVVVLGASYRLLQYLDPARAAQYSPQADEIDAKRPFGSGNNATRQLYALYQQRLNEERLKQQQQYAPRVHYSR